jgi:hypothetical protein
VVSLDLERDAEKWIPVFRENPAPIDMIDHLHASWIVNPECIVIDCSDLVNF